MGEAQTIGSQGLKATKPSMMDEALNRFSNELGSLDEGLSRAMSLSLRLGDYREVDSEDDVKGVEHTDTHIQNLSIFINRFRDLNRRLNIINNNTEKAIG